MPIDFRDMTSKAKAAYETRTAVQKNKDAQERAARTEIGNAAVTILKTHVLPVLERARAEFAEGHIEATIATDFDVHSYIGKKPSVSFRCLGPKRRSDGWQFQAPAVFFTSDGNTIDVGAAKDELDRDAKEQIGKARPEEIEHVLAKAIQKALDAYYLSLEQHRHLLDS
jgi:hypothetical protein